MKTFEKRRKRMKTDENLWKQTKTYESEEEGKKREIKKHELKKKKKKNEKERKKRIIKKDKKKKKKKKKTWTLVSIFNLRLIPTIISN